MELFSNYLLTAIFLALGVWMLIGWIRTHKYVEVKERMWSPSRILFMVAAGLAVLTMVAMKSVADYIRAAATIFCIILFLLQRNGMGNGGVADLGKMVNWSDIKAYDYAENDKKFTVYMTAIDEKSKNHKQYTIEQDYELKDKESVKQILKDNIGKKYRRMKKTG
ncbi:MAG: hypothetical protein IJ120_01560 [Solobacterium sp.]|nr:hypothetical protein [Solobacterium sp.]